MAKQPENKFNAAKAAELKKASEASEKEKNAGFNSQAFPNSDDPKNESLNESDAPITDKIPQSDEAAQTKKKTGIDEDVPAKYRKFK